MSESLTVVLSVVRFKLDEKVVIGKTSKLSANGERQ